MPKANPKGWFVGVIEAEKIREVDDILMEAANLRLMMIEDISKTTGRDANYGGC